MDIADYFQKRMKGGGSDSPEEEAGDETPADETS